MTIAIEDIRGNRNGTVAERGETCTSAAAVFARPTLVLGGTGKTGRRVAERLAARGLPVRVGSRSGKPPFDWENPDTWPRASEGVESVYVSYYPDIAIPGAVEAVRSFTELAVQSRVRRLVLLSGRGEGGAQTGGGGLRGGGGG